MWTLGSVSLVSLSGGSTVDGQLCDVDNWFCHVSTFNCIRAKIFLHLWIRLAIPFQTAWLSVSHPCACCAFIPKEHLRVRGHMFVIQTVGYVPLVSILRRFDCNKDTSVMWTLGSVPLVSILRGFDCNKDTSVKRTLGSVPLVSVLRRFDSNTDTSVKRTIRFDFNTDTSVK